RNGVRAIRRLRDGLTLDRIAVERRRTLIIAVAEARPDFGPRRRTKHDDLASGLRLVLWIPEHQRRCDAGWPRESAIRTEVGERNAPAVYCQAPLGIIRPGAALHSSER